MNTTLKLRTMLIVVLALTCVATRAQSIITLTWYVPAEAGNLIEINATAGETFTIDWGDSIEQITGTGNMEVITHIYTHGGSNSVRITADGIDCLITEFDCHDLGMTALDVSGCPELKRLDCPNGQLTSLDVSKNTELIHLNCRSNWITSLDVSACTELIHLECRSNQLTSLDVSKNTKLMHLECYDNPLKSLDVSKNVELIHLECWLNQLTSLDVSKNTELVTLYCFDNQLTNLDVSKNTELTHLQCGNNLLTSLDVSKNTELVTLYCFYNQLTSLDVSNNTKLTLLSCPRNQLTSLNVSENTALTMLSCFNNRLSILDLYTISKKISDTYLKYLGTQELLPQSIEVNTPYCDGQDVFEGIYTEYSNIEKNGTAAKSEDYNVANGKITFNTEGVYTFVMTNNAIISRESSPAMVKATLNVSIITSVIETTVRQAEIVGYYSIMGIKLSQEPASGIYIIKYDNGKTVKAIK